MRACAGGHAEVRADVAAVVVTYHPDPVQLLRLLDQVKRQVGQIWVIDNASSPPLTAAHLDDPALTVVRLDANHGVATAQNRGIQLALATGASYVLLLDQDSLPAPDMTTRLHSALADAEVAGLRVAAAGPLIVEHDGGSEGFVRFNRGRYQAIQGDAAQTWLPCDMLISSGTLIPSAVLRAVGTMADQLFIDKVDTEWSLRASAAGFSLIGVPQARLVHQLGERAVRVWFFGWRRLRLHRPFRYYYMLRNSLLVQRMPHGQSRQAWRRAERRQLLSIVLYFGLLAPGRAAALMMMWRGLLDGLRGIGGPLR